MAITLPGDDTTKQHLFEVYGSVNVRDARTTIKNEEWAWLENVVPIGDGNLRTMYAENTALYSATGGQTIVYYYPYNIGSTAYQAVFFDDGTAIQVRVSDGATTTISSTAGLFYATNGTLPACCQWQSKYLSIVGTTSSNAFWLWNGSVLFGPGTLGPDVVITNPGAGYTSAPTVTAYGGSGSGATFTATVANGVVTQVVVNSPGSGYLSGDVVQIKFAGGGASTTATGSLTVNTSAGGLGAVNLTNGGSGYTTASVISFSGGGGTGAEAVISGIVNGKITAIQVTNTGSGYTSAPTMAITVGTGASWALDMRYGQVSGVSILNGGTGYIAGGTPQVVISPPDQPALPLVQAVAAVSGVTGGAISAVTVTTPGLGYTKGTVTFVGGNNAAQGVASVMPFGISGTTIETYQGHIWVANGTRVQFTAPGSTTNFATSAGGGAFQTSDSFLRNQITRLIANSGFLYLLGDSSINVISNVQTVASTSSAGVTSVSTTFSNSNIDPQVGTVWRDSVVAFQRALVFGNPTGIYALYGGAAQKVSDQLDPLFSAASFNQGTTGVTPTAAVATIFGIKVLVFNMTTTDPYSNTARTIQMCWNGTKWFAATGLQPLTYLVTHETNSVVSAIGNSGTALYILYQTPSTATTKVWRSKLRADPSYIIQKQALRAYLSHQINNLTNYATVTIAFDSDAGNNVGQLLNNPMASVLEFQNSARQGISFTTTPPATVSFAINNYTPTGSDVQGYGTALGLTGQTTAGDVTIISMSLLWREYSALA